MKMIFPMRRTLFFVLLALIVVANAGCSAQGREIRRADSNLNRGNVEAALEHITEAMELEEAQNDPEAWLVKSRVYMEIALSEDPEVRALAENPVDVADEALTKAEELDEEGSHVLDIQQALLLMSELTFNEGVKAYEEEDWEPASDNFLRSYELTESFDSPDTTTLYNAALSAELGSDYDRAMDLYLQLKDMEYEEPYLYSSLGTIAMFQGDTLKATQYVQEGREKYPEDLDLIFAEANIHIFTGDVEQARDILDLAIEKDPDNPNLYFAFGANYDKMAQDTMYTEEEREFAYKEAVEAYEKAIELQPDYFDAIYNLGVLHFNKGITIFEEADAKLRETHDFAQYEEDAEEFKAVWLEAQPYLEKAMEMIDEDDPDYETVVISLVELYARTEQEDKLKEMEDIYMKYFGDEEGEQIPEQR